MAVTPTNFASNTQLTNAAPVIVVEAPITGQYHIVYKLSFRNTGSSRRVVTVYVVDNGGSSTTGRELAKQAIPADTEWNCYLAQNEVLSVGMQITALQDAGTDVNVNCSGSTVS